MSEEMIKRLSFVMHRAWVETRLLAIAGKSHQIAMLADIMELIPGIVANDRKEELEVLERQLEDYIKKYDSRFECLRYLHDESWLTHF